MKYTFGGGINELNDIAVSNAEAIEGKNFDLGLGNQKFKPRRPITILDTATNASAIHGIHQLIKQNNTKTTLVAAGTTMYEWDGGTFTSRGTITSTSELHDFSWDLDETIIIVDRNKDDVVKEWNGTTLSNLTTGLVNPLYAKYGLVHNGRVLLANITDNTTEIPHMVLFSEFEDRENYDLTSRAGASGFTTGEEPFYLLSPDLKPINGLAQFQDVVICSTENGQLYKLVGDDATNYQWVDFYKGSAAIGVNSIVNAGDDVYYMRDGGVIESLRSTDRYGDVGTDDISLVVRETVKDSTGMRAVYDQTNRKILFFLDSKILVLHKDLIGSESSPFTIYKTQHPVAFNTDAVRYMEYPSSSNSDKTILFGDDDGNIFDLNGDYGGGDGASCCIIASRKMPLQPFDYNTLLNGRVYYRREGECDLNMQFDWGDERSTTDLTVTLKGTTGDAGRNFFGAGKYFADGEYFSEGFQGAGNPVSKGFSAMGKGTTVFVTLEVETSEYFEIDYIEV